MFEQFNKVSFYVVAHADDWQLFMHPGVYTDLVSPACKVVFAIITAGDAGMDDGYWAAREEGSKSSIRFCLAPWSGTSETSGTREFNNHPVHYWSINNTTSYFLRLPDGNLDGGGFPAFGFQSLLKLKSGQINALTAVDNSATYRNWPEFISTLESIISFENTGISDASIHYINPDIAFNPGDHTDHLITGSAIQNMTILPGLRQLLFVGYHSSSGAGTLSSPELFWKAGMFAAYEKAVYDLCGYSTLRENSDLYVKWCCSTPKVITILPATYK